MTKAASVKGSELTVADADTTADAGYYYPHDDEDNHDDDGVQVVVATLLSRLLRARADRKCGSSRAAIVLVDCGALVHQLCPGGPSRAFAALTLLST